MLINVNVFNIMYEWLARGTYIMRCATTVHCYKSGDCIAGSLKTYMGIDKLLISISFKGLLVMFMRSLFLIHTLLKIRVKMFSLRFGNLHEFN